MLERDERTKPVADISVADFAEPTQVCDLVMKGGITSGIVYPWAILRIAQRFKLKNIGGTSAGAIAASLAAAAEFRRQTAPSGHEGDGFMKLKTQISGWLAKGNNLRSLFVPAIVAVPLYYTFLWVLNVKSALKRPTAWGIFQLAVSGALLAFLAMGFGEASFQWHVPHLRGVPQLIFMMAVVAIVALVVELLYLVPRSNYGMCTGGRELTLPFSPEPLTFWLSRQIDDIAQTGVDEETGEQRPLTFGDLWAGRVRAAGELGAPMPDDPKMNLEMVTTCLTMGRPFRLPFWENDFYFNAAELERFFPPYVVKWMVDHGRRPTPGTRDSFARHDTLHEDGFLPLPAPGDLPVIVAARLSLSFPLLMSALRLYAVDDNPQSKPAQDGAGTIEQVWFSDGGLSSNFPISFFDSPIPKWPTLAITLESFPSPIKNPTLDESVWMATDNNAGIGSVWDRFSQSAAPSNTPGFYGAIIGAMQNWQDTMQSEVPGFRDRIAHVRLTAAEGGLNLTMPPQTIQALMARGDRAGELLVEHFQIPVPGVPPFKMTWTNHRWVRTRTALDVVQRYTEQFEDSWNYPQTPSYRDLIAGGLTPASMSYPFVYPGQVTAAQKAAGDLLDIAAATQPAQSSLSGADAPAPISDLVVRPRY